VRLSWSPLEGPSAVRIGDVPEPSPSPGQLLIDVHNAGVVFPDLLNTRGEYQMRPTVPFIPGWDVAGVVRDDAEGFRAGDRVAAVPLIGGFAETVAVDAQMVFPLPQTISFATAAALPLNYLTMHFALLRRARLEKGATVRIHGAAGGLGTAACQLAAAYGARVLAVVSTPEKGAAARAAGADEIVFADDFRDAVSNLTQGRGVDVVVDPVGGDRFVDSLRCLAAEGRLLVLGFTGRSIPTVKVNRLLLTNTTVIGAASEEFWQMHPAFPRRQWDDLLPMFQARQLEPIIGQVFSLDQVTDALQLLDDRRAVRRAVIRIR
jgi:NADPH:quinone reductase